jgi:hypothetical protein
MPSGLGATGILAPAPHHHALLLAGHAWTHEPLRRVVELVDVAILTHTTERAAVRELAHRWGCERVWETTERAVDAMFYGAAPPIAMRAWARHLQDARERTVLEIRLLRLAAPAWGMPVRRAQRMVLGAGARHLRRHDGERWRTKLARSGSLVRHAARPRSELRQLGHHET